MVIITSIAGGRQMFTVVGVIIIVFIVVFITTEVTMVIETCHQLD